MSSVTCYMEGIVNSPMINVATILGEVEEYKEWMPITPVSKVQKEVTHMRKLLYIRNSLQWPCRHREIFVEGSAFVIKDEKAIGLSLESIREGEYFGHQIKRDPEHLVETHINKGFMYLQYLNEQQSIVKCYINIDIHLDLIPSVIMNWGMKNICGYVFDFIKQNSE